MSEASPPVRRHGVSVDHVIPPLVLLILVAAIGTVAISLGPDGGYDLRNYHFYIGWALFNKPFGYDIAPGQVQSYFNPVLDGLFYQLWRLLNFEPRLFTFVWAIPQAFAVWFAFLITLRLFPEPGASRWLFALATALIAAGGATSIGVVGTSMSESLPNALVLAAAWLVVSEAKLGYRSGRLLLAGLLAGAAIGLKLTTACYAVGFAAALLLTPPQDGGPRLRRLLAFGLGGVAGWAAIGGPWSWLLYQRFGNPFFPLYNAIFHSPDYSTTNFFDNRFLPKTLYQWLFYPLDWTLRKSRVVSEVPVRDARIAAALVGSIALLLCRVLRRPDNRPSAAASWCAVWMLGTYVAWLPTFSILRYLSGAEAMSGVVIVAAVNAVCRGWAASRVRVGAAAVAAILIAVTTVYPIWDRREFPVASLLDVSMPRLPADSVVIVLVATPASYTAAYQAPSVRYIGVNNILVLLKSTFGLQSKIEAAIRTASGPIWGIDKTDDFFGLAERSLERYHLRRTDECFPIESNQDTHLRVCRLQREAVAERLSPGAS